MAMDIVARGLANEALSLSPNVLNTPTTLYVGSPIQQSGTVTIEAATPNRIVGNGTSFLSVDIGTWIGVNFEGIYYWLEVDSVIDDTNIDLVNNTEPFSDFSWATTGGGSDLNDGTDPEFPLASFDGLQAKIDTISYQTQYALLSIVLATPFIQPSPGGIKLYFYPNAIISIYPCVIKGSMKFYLFGGNIDLTGIDVSDHIYINGGNSVISSSSIEGNVYIYNGISNIADSTVEGTIYAMTNGIVLPAISSTAVATSGAIIYPGVYGTPPA